MYACEYLEEYELWKVSERHEDGRLLSIQSSRRTRELYEACDLVEPHAVRIHKFLETREDLGKAEHYFEAPQDDRSLHDDAEPAMRDEREPRRRRGSRNMCLHKRHYLTACAYER